MTLIRLDEAEAKRELADGKVVAVLTVPPGFVATLQQMVKSPTLELAVTRGGTSGRVRQQVQALVYTLNLKLQRAYIDANLEYVRLLLHGGDGHFLGQSFDVIGLDGTKRELAAMPQTDRVKRIEDVRSRCAACARTNRRRAACDGRADPARGRAAARPNAHRSRRRCRVTRFG